MPSSSVTLKQNGAPLASVFIKRLAVEKEFVADAHVVRRHHKGQTIGDEAEMADERLIENAVDEFTVVAAALGLATDFCFFSRSKVAHSRRLAVAGALRQEPIWISR